MEPATVNILADDAAECCNYTIKQRLNIVISVEIVFINLYKLYNLAENTSTSRPVISTSIPILRESIL